MSTELADIHPTRLELLRLRRRKALAEGIIDILNKDLEALMSTLFELLKETTSLRGQSRLALEEAYHLFKKAEMIRGSKTIEEVSLSSQPIGFKVSIGSKSGVLGLSLPTYQLVEDESSPAPRFSMMDTPAFLDESISRTTEILNHVIKLAEVEASIIEMLDVISIKRRQVNRLQYKVLPQLEKAIRYVELILEETERQDAIRVRVLQRKRKERVSTTT